MNFTSIEALLTLIAIVVALFIGICSWIQILIIQKKEKKNRLLNEIIDWSFRLLACWNENYPIRAFIPSELKENMRLNILANSYVVFQRQEEYYRFIAKHFDKVLPALEDVLDKLEKLIGALAYCTFDQLDHQRKDLMSDANVAFHDSVKTLLGILVTIKIRL